MNDSHQIQIQKLQLLLLKHDIHLFPNGLQNQQERVEELIQIIKDDQDFNDNLSKEVNKFLATDPLLFKYVLDYDTNLEIYKEYNEKLIEYNKSQEKILESQKKTQELQKDISKFQAFIHRHFIRDQEQVQLMEDIFEELNQHQAQASQEIINLDRNHILELRGLNSPPQQARKVAEMLVLLLNNQSATQNNPWKQFQSMLADLIQFRTKITQFKVDKVSLTPLTIARNLFESINQEQCQRSSQFAYTLYKWSQHQFQIFDILNTFQIGMEDLNKHRQAGKFQENIKKIKSQIKELECFVQENQNKKQLQRLNQEDKAIKFLQTIKWFDKLQISIKQNCYAIKITNYMIKFLQQYHWPKTKIDQLLDQIRNDLFPNHTIFYDQNPLQTYQYPIIINIFKQNSNFDTLAHDILFLVKNPIQFYNNLKQLNYLINCPNLIEEIHSLVYQIYFNFQQYSELLLQDILEFIYQAIIINPNSIEFTVHQLLEMLHVNQIERECLMGIIGYIKEECKINILHQIIQFKNIPLVDYFIHSYFQDNQNKIKLQINEQHLEAIKSIILKEKLDIDETIQNIMCNLQIILDSKEYFNQVNREIDNIKQSIIDDKNQSEILREQLQQHNEFRNLLKDPYLDLLRQKNCLEVELRILKDKDLLIKEQIDQSNNFINRPIHHGIKMYELAFFKSFSKFNPIAYFASKITLIQLGIYQFTPDMIQKHLGSHKSFKKLMNLAINNLTMDQQGYLSQSLLEFNENNILQKFQNKAIQNLIKRPYRIFYLQQLQYNNNQLLFQRTDLLQKQRVIRNKLNIINKIKIDLDQLVISKLNERTKQLQKELEVREESDNQLQKNIDQFKDMQLLQEFINEIIALDSINLCLYLIKQNFTEIQIMNWQSNQLYYLIQIFYQHVPKSIQKEQSKFNLLLIYLQDQYRNSQIYLKEKYENKGLFKTFKKTLLVDALSYWSYYNSDAKTNLNILIGICSYQLFYNELGNQIQAICIQPEHNINDDQRNTNYQVRVLYEILQIKYSIFTLSVMLKFLKQVIHIKQNISSIQDILRHQINIEENKVMEFKEFQQEVQEILKLQIKEFLI